MITTTTIHSDNFYKAYNIQSAVIHYIIQGEGNITKNSDFEIRGRASLVFNDWGATKLYKERYKEISIGTTKSTKVIRRLHLEDYGTIYDVNFDKKQIETRDDPIIKEALKSGIDLSNKFIKKAKLVGHSTILGYPCEEWKYKSKKQCIYKGVVIKEELNLLDLNIFKVAISIDFNSNITDDNFELPTFLENKSKGFLLKESIGLTTQADECIIDNSISIQKDNISTKKLTVELFRKQQELLPQLLREMQEARVCLENAEDNIEANICLDKVLKLKESINGEVEESCEIRVWTKEARDAKLDILEERIWRLKREMPCIRRSQNIDDLSECMQKESI
jgi:hypothetical protein